MLLGEDDTTLDGQDDACFDEWTTPELLDIPVLGAVVQIQGRDGDFQALTDVGRLLEYQGTSSVSEQIGEVGGTAGLHAFVEVGAELRVAVGDGGQIWRGGVGANNWALVDSGITGDFHTVLSSADGAWIVATTDSQALMSSDQGETWTNLDRPVGLQHGFWVDSEVWFVGKLGQIWSWSDPASDWTELATPTDDDLIAGGSIPGCSTCTVVLSDSAIFARDSAGEWTTLTGEFSLPLTTYDYGRFATADGEIWEITEPGTWTLSQVAIVDFTPTALGGDDDEIHIAGSDGELLITQLTPGC